MVRNAGARGALASFWLVMGCLLGLGGLVGCSSDSEAPKAAPTPTNSFGGNARMKEGVVVLPEAASQNAQVTATTVDFPRAGNDALLATLKPGAPLVGGRRTSVLASNNALGILRKVVKVSGDDVAIHVETAPAVLSDVFEGDFSVSTPPDQLTAINPAGLDVVSYFFGDDPGVDLATCDASGVCTPEPDDGSGVVAKAYMPAPTNRKSPLYGALPSRYVAPLRASGSLSPQSLTAEDLAGAPAAVGAALSDVVAVHTHVRAVAEKGLDSFSKEDTQKLFRILARNFADAGDTKNAEAATTLANYVEDPTQFKTFQTILRKPVPGGLAAKNFITDIIDGIVSVAKEVINAITSLLDVNVTLSMGTLGRTKDRPFTMSFLAGSQVKKLGKAEYAISTTGTVSAYAYVSTEAHFDGHIGIPSHATFWLGGRFGAGAAVDAQLKAALQSTSGEENLVAALLANPTRSATPWSKKLATLGPYAGPSIGPVPTAFNVELSLECAWSLYGQVQYNAAIDLSAEARIGATISTNDGWGLIGKADWNRTSSQNLMLGGGAEVECGLNTKVDWLIADVVGPYVTLQPGVKAETTYTESCAEATGNSPDGATAISVAATLGSEVGATIDFAGFSLGDLKATDLFDEEWELYSAEREFPGGGYGYCSISCNDGRRNGTETDSDCGGDCSAAGKRCKSGQACKVAGDCAKGGSCIGSRCADPAYCSSGTMDGDETDQDCGGSCAGCAVGKACTVASDCQSLHCDHGACIPATCGDGQRNGNETDVDCGSTDCLMQNRFCSIGQRCTDSSQCAFGTECVGGSCAPPATCANGRLDPGEASWDCGGPCPACTDGSWCTKDVDCKSGVCKGGMCAAPSCTDGARNADETDVDCGGSCSGKGERCAHGESCKIDGDCVTNDRCIGGICVPPAHCSDGVKNSGETDVDCGGGECFACGTGRVCAATSDCLSSSCLGGVCRTASCNDHVKDQDETDVDCGGVCNANYNFCSAGQSCRTNADCGNLSGTNNGATCSNGVCVVPAECKNFRVDTKTSESDVDCGGSCARCTEGKRCAYEEDCASGSCGSKGFNCIGSGCDIRVCRAATCDDRARNGDETDVDCGGSCAASGARCSAGQRCSANSDCLPSNTCVTGICVAPASCTDGAKNGAESDVDCGGGICGKCSNDKACRGPLDCASGACSAAGKCVPASCTDRIKNGDEIDVDCGGSCGACIEGQKCFGSLCGAGLTCSSYVSGTCFDHTCDDGTKNNSETDVDCGGGHCAPCGERRKCSSGRDCKSGVCNAGSCAAESCSDGVLNGDETDIDCGGRCGSCGSHRRCSAVRDCASGSCIAGACQDSSCTDGLRNGNETAADCGGSCVATGGTCQNGFGCGIDADCNSGFCLAGVCATSSCTDGVKHGTETDADCGGVCSKCATGKTCASGADCTSGVCDAGTKRCATPSCGDGVKNGNETALDCGGGCATCADLAACLVNTDCKSRYCKQGSCAVASCNDGVSDGTETAIDCGGTCGGCATGVACKVGSDCLTGVCTGGACAAATCSDAVKNGNETDTDCGGSCVANGQTCASGKHCTVNGDCVSGSCNAGTCEAAATCNDGRLNGNETDVDCGGSCTTCYFNQKCRVGADCEFGVCSNNLCAAPSCSDGVKNGNETDVDCGAGNCASCATGKRCVSAGNCVAGNTCVNGFCTAPASCTDGVKNGSETDTDCGGSCTACAVDKVCMAASDCQSAVCTGGKCRAATCSDGIKNQDETDLDCGGACAAAGNRCVAGKRCAFTTDCASPTTCVTGVCTTPATCSDGLRNQDETDIDCGGTNCGRCVPGKTCGGASDCSSTVCSGGLCASPSCNDSVKNGNESDADCGGSCSACATGKVCSIATDCQSTVCTGGTCRAATCSDGIRNQDETGIDCGGPCVGAGKQCTNGTACSTGNDCQSNYCAAGLCASASCNDGVQNGSETDVDCGGGSCPKCAKGLACVGAADCLSSTCTALVCAAPACAPTCGTGASCSVAGDCASGVCTNGSCVAPTCGPTCTDGQACGTNADCASGVCKNSLCAPLFASPSVSLVPDTASWLVAAGDIDSDGKVDLGVTTDDGNFDIFYGTGPGAFATSVFGPNQTKWDIYAGLQFIDVNGDGKLDVLTSSSDKPLVYLGNGTRSYGAPIGTVSSSNLAAFGTGDLNGDGRIDFVGAAYTPTQIKIYTGNGTGAFTAGSTYLLSGISDYSKLDIGDVNGDGRPDVVVSVLSEADNRAYIDVFPGTGNATFGARSTFLSSSTVPTTSIYSLALADVTEDGKLDALVGVGGKLNLLVGNGDGSFQAPTQIAALLCSSVKAADLNGDGHVDVACSYDQGLAVLLGTGGGALKPMRQYATTTSTNVWGQQLVFFDVDGDGDLDAVQALAIASAAQPSPSRVFVMLNGWH